MAAKETGLPIDEKTIAERLGEARELRGLTTGELARLIGVRVATLKAWEAGTSVPRANRLQMIAGILNVPLTWLFGGVSAHAPEEDLAPMGGRDPALRLLHLQQLHRKMGEELEALVRELSEAGKLSL